MVRDPAKVVVLRVAFEGSRFHATSESPFVFSGMGGTIGMEKFRVFGLVTRDGMRLEFYSRASCLGVRGNGASYAFSPELVNKLCDASLYMQVVGGAQGRPTDDSSSSFEEKMDRLLVWADPETGAIEASVGPIEGPDPSCPALLFVDGRPWRIREGDPVGCARPNVRRTFSIDALLSVPHLGLPGLVVSLLATVATVHLRSSFPISPLLLIPLAWLGAEAAGPGYGVVADLALYAALAHLLIPKGTRYAWAIATCAAVTPWVALAALDGGPGAVVHPELRGRTFDALAGNTLPLVVAALAVYFFRRDAAK